LVCSTTIGTSWAWLIGKGECVSEVKKS
jgi:hypothetical protein